MNTFPVDFTPDSVLNAKKLRREKRRREKIEREKCVFRAAIVEKVTQEDENVLYENEETWWWKVDVDKQWEESTFEEIQSELRAQQWLIQHFPHYESAIVCSRIPTTDEEIKHFFD